MTESTTTPRDNDEALTTGPDDQDPTTVHDDADAGPVSVPWLIAGLLVVLALGILVHILSDGVPKWTSGTTFGKVAKSIEFPVYAIAIGLIGNALLSAAGVRDRLLPGFRTEFFIKTGLVLLGASINIAIVARAALPAIAQAVLLISIVFLFTWWVAGRFGLDDRLRALLSAAVSICGVSAAIAAAGAVKARKEDLAYTASLVIIFALPAIFILPWAAHWLGLSPTVTGAWIGGNIDTTAAVTAAGTIAGEQPLQIATIVKVTQNALLGVAAVLLTVYFAYRVERKPGEARPTARAFWDRFPKFVLGFIAASLVATVYTQFADPAAAKANIAIVNNLRTWFLIFAFISIGLEFKVTTLKQAGWRPIVVFAFATVANLVVGLGLSLLLFSSFEF